LSAGGGFVPSGTFNFVNFAALPNIYQRYNVSFNGRNDYALAVPQSSLDRIDALLEKGVPVIIKVDFYAAPVLKNEHFVLIDGKNSSGGYTITDPWDGVQKDLCPRYGKTAALAIYSILWLDHNPVQSPKKITAVGDIDIYGALPVGKMTNGTAAQVLEEKHGHYRIGTNQWVLASNTKLDEV